MQTKTSEARSTSAATSRVLIIEDDADVARAIAEVLESEGYLTATAGNGCEALRHLEEDERPSVILLDMTMPLMDGPAFRVEQVARSELASIPVVLLTADGHARSKASSIKADGYLTKPVTIDDLLDEVARFCVGPGV